MLDEEEYSSDTSDDDYVPAGVEDGNSSSNASEDDEEVSDEESDGEEQKGKKGKQKKKRKQKKTVPAADDEAVEKAPNSPKLDSKRVESLWASFKETAPAPVTKSDAADKSSTSSEPSAAPAALSTETKPAATAAAAAPAPKPSPLATTSAVKRPAIKSGGLADLASRLGGKKTKLSTLEKSKKDWDSFKKAEGIEEDLKTFNQGKMGFLERQAFLERADVKQFEIEKGLRLGRKPQ